MPNIKVHPLGETLKAKSGENLRSCLMRHGITIKSTCGGFASCSDCIVKILSGKKGLSPVTLEEEQLLGNVFHLSLERLSCQTFIEGDVVVDITNQTQKETKSPPKVIRRKASEQKDLSIKSFSKKEKLSIGEYRPKRKK